MLEFVHAATGGIIALKIGSPLISLPLAVLSHFILDLLPHWNPHLNTEMKKLGHLTKKTIFLVFTDCFIGFILGLALAFKALPDINKTLVVLCGCFFGILPDLIEAPYFFFRVKNKILKRLVAFQSKYQWNIPLFFGLLTQIVFLILLFGLL